jgi:hypothetical protein
MRAVFVNPFQVDLVQQKGRIYTRTWTPLDLAYCAAVLRRDGHEVDVVDANAERLAPEAVGERVRGATGGSARTSTSRRSRA